ncbi:PadR family transcriptional regulator [Nocardiopsis composta]|uniref:PadR family transcriptional regulator n=1 Tax=Nocardiopsis composta TaxID=157465 RepID=UPI0031E04256
MSRRTPRPPASMLALAVLKLLDEEPLHPYEIMRRIRVRAYDKVVKATHASVYDTVARLAATGMAAEVATGRAGRRPERTVYAITDAGRAHARQRLTAALREPAWEYPVFTAGLSFIALLEPDEAAAALRARAADLAARAAELTAVLEGKRAEGLPRLYSIEVEQARRAAEAEEQWVREILADIASGALAWPERTRAGARDAAAHPGAGDADQPEDPAGSESARNDAEGVR